MARRRLRMLVTAAVIAGIGAFAAVYVFLGASRNPDGVMFYKVWNGRKNPKMPAFKSEMTRDDIWTVIQYAKTLRK